MRFWKYVILGIFSGVVGMIFGLTQNKIHLNWETIILFALGFIGIIIFIVRLNTLTKDYQTDLELLEKEE
jgi:H+/Cl- antiporter ClcA